MIKLILKKILKYIRRLFFKKIIVNSDFEIIKIGIKNIDCLAGYYDLSPFSQCGRYLIFLGIDKKSNKSEAEVLCFDIKNPNKKPESFGKTDAWSWQLGARLRWGENDKTLCYNVLKNNKPFYIIKDFKTKKKLNQIPSSVYDIDKSYRKILTLNFKTLYDNRPGYGFECDDSSKGITLYDLNTKKKKLIYTLKEAKRKLPSEFKNSYDHYFNHLSWSMNGNSFIFFHIWKKDKKKFNQVLNYNLEKNSISEVSKLNEIASHYTWISNSELILTISVKGKINYFLVNLLSKTRKVLNSFPKNLDGHPSQNPKDKNLFVTDSYPDIFDEQSVFIVNIRNNCYKRITKFYTPEKFFGVNKCDLHPRWSKDGKMICCDSTAFGKREIFIIKNIKSNN